LDDIGQTREEEVRAVTNGTGTPARPKITDCGRCASIRKVVVWGIRPPDPPEMAETLKFQAKVFKYEMPYGLKIAPNPRLKAVL